MTQQNIDILGYPATDKLTGLTGLVTGIATFLTSAPRALIEARVSEATGVKSEWFDIARLEVDLSAPRVVLGS